VVALGVRQGVRQGVGMNTYQFDYAVKDTYTTEIKAETYEEATKIWHELYVSGSQRRAALHMDSDVYLIDAIEISDKGESKNDYLESKTGAA
jgi:hypothetical protein